MKVLITGGTGYIGSTVASACLDAGHAVVLLDDLSVGPRSNAAGRDLHVGDVADGACVDAVFAAHPDIDAAVHCAARTVVPDSVTQPLRYYDSNVAGTLALLGHLLRHGCRRLVFSSSASVYATGRHCVDEDAPLGPSSPYARSKAMSEQILGDVAAAGPLRVVSLRYFNPVGVDPGLRTGPADPVPAHVLGRLVGAHRDGRPFVLHGTDWPTRDGTPLRDFVHVWDLARAHVAALERFDDVTAAVSHRVLNLGTGHGTTVRELVAAFAAATGGGPDVLEGPRRPGDVVGGCADPARAAHLLGWRAQRPLVDGVRDALAWAQRRPAALAAAGG